MQEFKNSSDPGVSETRDRALIVQFLPREFPFLTCEASAVLRIGLNCSTFLSSACDLRIKNGDLKVKINLWKMQC